MKACSEMTEAEIRAEMGTPQEMATEIGRALWVRSEYIEGVMTMFGGAPGTEDGCYGVAAGGGMVYRYYAGDGYETGVTVTLGPEPDGGPWQDEPVVATTASVTLA